LLLTFLLGFTGCGTIGGPASASFASVTIKDHTVDEIHWATGQVFETEGYVGGKSSPLDTVWEKEASRLTTISRDGLVAAQAGAISIERVRTQLVELGTKTYRLQCTAYMVSSAGDSFFENEVRLSNVRSAPYQIMLGKVQKTLQEAY
jgi:hypothetical protein